MLKTNSRIFPLCFILFLGIFRLQADDRIIPDPDPFRFQEEISRFILWDQKNSWPENAVLFVGSSSIRMWRTQEGFPDIPVINRGFGGAHISDVIFYYSQILKPYDPKLIVLYAGDNDVSGGKSPEQVLEDYQVLVKQIREDHPSAHLIFIPIKPSRSRWNFWPAMQRTNRLIADYNKQHPDLHDIDLATPLLDSAGHPDSTLFLEDQLHLNGSGYAAWESVLKPFLDDLFRPD